MKKTMTIFGVILFASFILTSCGGNSIESDAKKLAELMCKAQKLYTEGSAKAETGDMSAFKESAKIAYEAEAFANEMQGKYKDAADYQKFTTAYLKAMGDCK
jgi:predicted small secreted protein